MGGGASRELEREKEKASREIAEAREAAAAQENRVDELQSQLESERARSAGLEIQLKDLESGAHVASPPSPLIPAPRLGVSLSWRLRGCTSVQSD